MHRWKVGVDKAGYLRLIARSYQPAICDQLSGSPHPRVTAAGGDPETGRDRAYGRGREAGRVRACGGDPEADRDRAYGRGPEADRAPEYGRGRGADRGPEAGPPGSGRPSRAPRSPWRIRARRTTSVAGHAARMRNARAPS